MLFKRLSHYTIHRKLETPPYLIFFVTSNCNSRCEHCFYWRNLNKSRDLSLAEIEKISLALGEVDKLLLSGGEPFLRQDLPEIVKIFFRNNGVCAVNLPTNGLQPDLIVSRLEEILENAGSREIDLSISLDGTEKTHDKIRGVKGSFKKVVELYQKARPLKKNLLRSAGFPNLRVKFNATVSNRNFEDLFLLVDQFEEFFPGVKNTELVFSFLRGDPKVKEYSLPPVDQLRKLYNYRNKKIKNKAGLWERFVEKLTFEFRLKTIEAKRQLVPCAAGDIIGVVFDNGGVSLCELLPPIGNLSEKSFPEIWHSKEAEEARRKIKNGECWCYHECFIFPSLLQHPWHLSKVFWPFFERYGSR